MLEGATNGLRDKPLRYGLVSRFFHWMTAYLLLWQFCMTIGWRMFGDNKIMQVASVLGPSHKVVGILVLTLVIPRFLWALSNRHQSPVADISLLGRFAKTVYTLFYILMFIVPVLALLRAYGSGQGYALWGLHLVPKTDHIIPWLRTPADRLHTPLAWTLSCLIAGHILMAIFHSVIRRDGTMSRMI